MVTQRFFAAGCLFGLAFCGCYADFDMYAQRRARLDCVRLKKCNGDTFANRYDGDPVECREDREDELQDLDAGARLLGFEYEPEEGRLCLEAAHGNRKVCGSDAGQDIADACAEVWK